MAPSLDLHIGTHKTGTTAVQYACHTLRSRLLEHGVLYPAAARGLEGEPRYGHHRLQWGLRGARGLGPADAEAAWRDVAAEVAEQRPDHVVVSSEGFESLGPDGVRAVAEHARGVTEGQIRVVLYLRPLYAYLRSAYKQQLQSGTTVLPFDVFAARKAKKSTPGVLVLRWAEVFGTDAIEIRLFDAACAAPGGLLSDFLAVVTAPAPRPVPYANWLAGLDAFVNSSLSNGLAPAVLRINRLTDGLGTVGVPGSVRQRLRVRLLRSAAVAERRWPEPFAAAAGPLVPPAAESRVRALVEGAGFDALAPWLSPDDIRLLQHVG